MHMLIYALVEASTADEALAAGKGVFDNLVGVDRHSCSSCSESSLIMDLSGWNSIFRDSESRPANLLN